MNNLRPEDISELTQKLVAQEDLTISVIKSGLEVMISAGISKCVFNRVVVGLLSFRLLDECAGCDGHQDNDSEPLLNKLIDDSTLSDSQLSIRFYYPYKNLECHTHSKSLLSILRTLGEVSEDGLLSIIHYLRILDDVV